MALGSGFTSLENPRPRLRAVLIASKYIEVAIPLPLSCSGSSTERTFNVLPSDLKTIPGIKSNSSASSIVSLERPSTIRLKFSTSAIRWSRSCSAIRTRPSAKSRANKRTCTPPAVIIFVCGDDSIIVSMTSLGRFTRSRTVGRFAASIASSSSMASSRPRCASITLFFTASY